MLTEFKIPEVGENITSGTAVKILVTVGQTVKKDQSLMELETDKATIEVPSSVSGVVKEILIQAGAKVNVGQVVMKIDDGKGAFAGDATTTPAPDTQIKPDAAPAAAPEQQSAPKEPTAAPDSQQTAKGSPGGIIEFKIPEVGENITSGTAVKILVTVGQTVKKDQSLLELETDKATIEVPSSVSGVVKEILIKEGTKVNVGQVVMKIDSGATASTIPAAQPASPTAQSTAAVPTSTAPVQKSAPTPQPNAPVMQTAIIVTKEVAAAPSVRRLAREIGVNLGEVAGTGPGGRVSKDDVKAHAKVLITSGAGRSASTVAAPPLPDFTKYGEIERKPMNNIRKKTAEHLTHAWSAIPHVTQFDKADITKIEKLRKQHSTPERKLSITPFLMKIVAEALNKFPQFNASVDMATGETIYKKFYNIGVAVDTPNGLLVPVLRDIDKKTVLELSQELNASAQRAREKKITIDDMRGGTFTISNLGGVGGTNFTPIVNWPEVAILGVARARMEPVYDNTGNFVPGFMLPLSLSYDHRLIDGADGARFLRFIVEAIEQPAFDGIG
ncbi:MAG: dihydrolipoyllysine-residue acetyltransferase [Candidatus Omnitrophica bacterium]|nr:dihydrolipoyllysine-residue acetyltransferase [Candidatus Omnitrophota bacterium]